MNTHHNAKKSKTIKMSKFRVLLRCCLPEKMLLQPLKSSSTCLCSLSTKYSLKKKNLQLVGLHLKNRV